MTTGMLLEIIPKGKHTVMTDLLQLIDLRLTRYDNFSLHNSSWTLTDSNRRKAKKPFVAQPTTSDFFQHTNT